MSKSMSSNGVPISRGTGKKVRRRLRRQAAQHDEVTPTERQASTGALALKLAQAGRIPWGALDSSETGRALQDGWGWNHAGGVWRAPEQAEVRVRPDRTRGPRVTRERRAA